MSTTKEWFLWWSSSYEQPQSRNTSIQVSKVDTVPTSPSKLVKAPLSTCEEVEDDTVLEISPIDFE